MNSGAEELCWQPSFIVCQLKLEVSLTVCSYRVYNSFLGYELHRKCIEGVFSCLFGSVQ